jgi:hypothetical protein
LQIDTLRATLRLRGASLRRRSLLLSHPRRRLLLLKRLPQLPLRVGRRSVLSPFYFFEGGKKKQNSKSRSL